MAPARFGTDGVRGVANEELTAELALALGRATARVLPAPAFVVGRDTRRSGPLLQAAFSAGLAAEGADVVDLGVLPTPGVAAVAERRQVPGAVISASHNPFGDNGIKLFSRLGTKLPTEVEGEIERALDAILADPDRPPRRPTGHGVGLITERPRRGRAVPRTAHLQHRGPAPRRPAHRGRLRQRRRQRDRAVGAGRARRVGSPRCTTRPTAPTSTRSAARPIRPSSRSRWCEHQADLGLAFDGDADRAIAVDHAGHIVDGDVLLALFALDLAERGRLAENTVAVTVMTNLGFRLAMEARGIAVRETDVGDRHVLAALDAGGLSLGGEQSGHIIFRSTSTTGDGTLTGHRVWPISCLRSGRSLADLSAGLVERVPQRLVNVPIPRPDRLADCAEVWEAVVKAEAELGHEGRILLRPSGTEPLVRVMVEARVTKPRPTPSQPSSPASWRPPWGRSSRRHPGSLGPYVRHHRRHRRGRPVPILLDALHQLEYRGYDSAGIAMVVDGELWRARKARAKPVPGVATPSPVAELATLTAGAPQSGTRAAAIGHTRWATHGHPTDDNAHPHLDCTGRLALVHNGIIENYLELKADLEIKGHTFTSATDTEVMAHLIEDHLANDPDADLAEATRRMLRAVRGAFAIAVVHADEPDTIVGARRSTPLVFGLHDEAAFLASDIPALIGHTDQVFALADDELAVLTPGHATVTTLDGTPVTPEPLTITWNLEAAQKGGYDDFMSKEMHEQPDAIANTLLERRALIGAVALDEMRIPDDDLRAIDKVFIVACGSSYHAALVAKYAIEKWVRVPTEVDIASEFRYRDPVLNERTLFVGVSQSGETLDTSEAQREAARLGAKVLVVTNVVDSSMARAADGVLYTRAGPEIGVASTKCHLAQIVALEVLGLYLAQVQGALPAPEINRVLERDGDAAGPRDRGAGPRRRRRRRGGQAHRRPRLLLPRAPRRLPRRPGGRAQAEGAGLPAGGGLPGRRAQARPDRADRARAPSSSASPPATRCGRRCSPTSPRCTAAARPSCWWPTTATRSPPPWPTTCCGCPPTDPLLAPVVGVVPLQQLAYRLARLHGHDPDRPRNLAKTVTVE